MNTSLVTIYTQRLITKSLKWSGCGLTGSYGPIICSDPPLHLTPILISHHSYLTYTEVCSLMKELETWKIWPLLPRFSLAVYLCTTWPAGRHTGSHGDTWPAVKLVAELWNPSSEQSLLLGLDGTLPAVPLEIQ